MKTALVTLRPCISTKAQRGSLTSPMALFTSGFSELLAVRPWFKSSHGDTRAGHQLLNPPSNLVFPGVHVVHPEPLCGAGAGQLELS